MAKSEHAAQPLGLLAGIAAFVRRGLGGTPDPPGETEHAPLRDEPGPSGLPPAPPRVEKRGL